MLKHRTKPDFFIIGSQKCGTTVLKRMLRSCSEIYMPPQEVHYFDSLSQRSWNKPAVNSNVSKFYSNLFRKNEHLICGEKTPSYIAIPQCMVLISQWFPNAKIVICLRDPVVRWYSQQHAYGGKGKFYDYWTQVPDGRWRGIYDIQLQLVFSLFPTENIHIIEIESMRKDTKNEMHKVLKFLGVKSPNFEAFHFQSSLIYDEKLTKILIDYYAEHNKRLKHLLDEKGYDSNCIMGNWLAVK